MHHCHCLPLFNYCRVGRPGTSLHKAHRRRGGGGTKIKRSVLLCNIIPANMWKDIYGNLDSISINVLHHRRRAERKKFLKVFPEMRDEQRVCAFKWCMAPHSEEEKERFFFFGSIKQVKTSTFWCFSKVWCFLPFISLHVMKTKWKPEIVSCFGMYLSGTLIKPLSMKTSTHEDVTSSCSMWQTWTRKHTEKQAMEKIMTQVSAMFSGKHEYF